MYRITIEAFVLLGICLVSWSYGQPAPSKAPEITPQDPRKRALLIGINDYAEITDLQYACRDIQALRDRLLAVGFREEDVILLHDRAKRSLHKPFKASVEHHLDETLKSVGRDDLIFFAFSGHGVDLEGTSYLCPIEARLKDPQQTLVSLEHIYQRLDSSRAAQKVLLIDACRNDPRPGGERSLETPTDTLTRFARSLEHPPEGILVLSSCRPGEVSVEDDKIGHGVFMHFIIEGLQGEADRHGGNGNDLVSLFELYRYANLRTRTYVARTRDQMQTPVLRGEVTGDYELGRVSTRELEVEAAWSEVRDKPDLFVETSPILQWYLQMYKRMIERSSPRSQSQQRLPADVRQRMEQMYQRQMEMIERQVRRPEAIVLSNPSIVTTNGSEALLAIQRAYAFGIRGDWEGAIAAATEAIRLEPDNPFAYLMRGMAYVGQAGSLQRAQSMMGQGADPQTIVRMLEMAERNPTIAQQVNAVLSELGRAAPEIVRDLEAAKKDPGMLKRAVQTALAKLDSMAPLASALEDFHKIDIGVLVLLEDKAQLKSGNKVVGSVSGYVNYCEAKEAKGDWVRVEDVPGVNAPEAWAYKDQISQVFSYFELFQMVIR